MKYLLAVLGVLLACSATAEQRYGTAGTQLAADVDDQSVFEIAAGASGVWVMFVCTTDDASDVIRFAPVASPLVQPSPFFGVNTLTVRKSDTGKPLDAAVYAGYINSYPIGNDAGTFMSGNFTSTYHPPIWIAPNQAVDVWVGTDNVVLTCGVQLREPH